MFEIIIFCPPAYFITTKAKKTVKNPDEPKKVTTYIELAENPYLTVGMLELVTAEMEIYCRAQLEEMEVTEPVIVGIMPFSRRFFVGVQTSNLSVYKSEKGRQVALILSDALNRVKQYPIWLRSTVGKPKLRPDRDSKQDALDRTVTAVGPEVGPKKEIGFKITPDNKLEIQKKIESRGKQTHVLWVYEATLDPDEFDRMQKICALTNQRLSEGGKTDTEIMVDYSNGEHRFLYTGNKLSKKEEDYLIEFLRTCADEIDLAT